MFGGKLFTQDQARALRELVDVLGVGDLRKEPLEQLGDLATRVVAAAAKATAPPADAAVPPPFTFRLPCAVKKLPWRICDRSRPLRVTGSQKVC